MTPCVIRIDGERETRHHYTYGGGQRGYVAVDCETEVYVIEGGLDKRSSLDSLQQALFFSVLTGKAPAVVIYDTDGKVGKYERRIQAPADPIVAAWRPLRGDRRRSDG